MTFVRWHSPSQALIAKHVLYPQLTATVSNNAWQKAIIIFTGDEPTSKGASNLCQCSKWKLFLSSEMALLLKINIKKQVFWPLGHVPVVSTDSMTTDLEHLLGSYIGQQLVVLLEILTWYWML